MKHIFLFTIMAMALSINAQTIRRTYTLVQPSEDLQSYEVIEVEREETEDGSYAREIRSIKRYPNKEAIEEVLKATETLLETKETETLKMNTEITKRRDDIQKQRDEMAKWKETKG
jgi:cell division protein FtsL